MEQKEQLYQNIEKYLNMEESVYLITREEFLESIKKQQQEYEKLNQQVRQELKEINNHSVYCSTIFNNNSLIIKAGELDPLLKIYDERANLLESQNKQLQSNFYKVSDSMNIILKENRQLRKMNNQRNDEISKLMKNFEEEFAGQKQGYERELEISQRQNHQFINEILKLKTENELVQKSKEEYERNLESIKQEKFSKTLSLEETKKKEQILADKLTIIEKHNIQLKDQIQKLKEKNQQFERQFQNQIEELKKNDPANHFRLDQFLLKEKQLQNDKESLEKERRIFQEQEFYIKNKEKEIQLKHIEYIKLNKEHESLKNKYFELAANFTSQQEKLQKHQSLRDQFENEKQLLEYSQQQQIQQLSEQIRQTGEENNKLQIELESQRNQIEYYENQLKEIKENKKQESFQQISENLEEVQKLKIQLTYLSTEIQEKEYQIQRNDDELNYYRENKGRIKLYDQLLEENQNLRSLLEENGNENLQKDEQFLENKKKIKNLLKQIKDQGTEYEEQLDEITEENLNLLQELEQLYVQNKQLSENLDEYEQATNLNIKLIAETIIRKDLSQNQKTQLLKEMFQQWYTGQDFNFDFLNQEDTKDQCFQTEENFYTQINKQPLIVEQINPNITISRSKSPTIRLTPIEERTFYKPIEQRTITIQKPTPVRESRVKFSPQTIKKNTSCCQQMPCSHHLENCDMNKKCTRFKCYCESGMVELDDKNNTFRIPFILFDNQFLKLFIISQTY